jgi:hypothetical protein
MVMESSFFWGCNPIYSAKSEPALCINVAPSSSGPENKPSKNPRVKQIAISISFNTVQILTIITHSEGLYAYYRLLQCTFMIVNSLVSIINILFAVLFKAKGRNLYVKAQ